MKAAGRLVLLRALADKTVCACAVAPAGKAHLDRRGAAVTSAGIDASPPRSYPGFVSLIMAARACGILPAAAAGALTVGLLAGPAAAATTWTVSPGGPVTGHSNQTALIDTTTGTFGIFCASSSLHGKF